jgi:hypothetical protein
MNRLQPILEGAESGVPPLTHRRCMLRHRTREKVAPGQGKSMKGDWVFLTEAKYVSTYRASLPTGHWRDLVNTRELKIRQFCLLGFCAHNESGQSVGRRNGNRFKAEVIISLAIKTKLILDVRLLQQPSLIDKRKRAVLESGNRWPGYLAMLGLERKVKTLAELLTESRS